MAGKVNSELLDTAVEQHKEIGLLQGELVQHKSLEARLANLLHGYRHTHDLADAWGCCTCKLCLEVEALFVHA